VTVSGDKLRMSSVHVEPLGGHWWNYVRSWRHKDCCMCLSGEQWDTVTAGVQLLWAISDHKTNADTREVLNIHSWSEVTVDHTNRRTQRLSWKNDKHNSKLAYGYISDGRRNIDRPRERWRERKPCGCNEHRMAQILPLLMTKALI